MGWAEFAAAFAVFFMSHAVPLRPPVRPWFESRLGPGGFTRAYSALSLAVLAWLIGATGRAPYVPLWDWAPWQNQLVLVAMIPVCAILALAITQPNPFSFGGARNANFDPSRAGIVRLVRHPLLLALAIWAGAHLVPNGDLAHMLLFVTFAGFALIGGRLVDRRKMRALGPEGDRLLRQCRAAPVRASFAPGATLVRLALGGALYLVLIWLHPVLFGVHPLP